MKFEELVEAKKYDEIFKIPEYGLKIELDKCDFEIKKYTYDGEIKEKIIMTFEGNKYYIPSRLFSQMQKLKENKITRMELKQVKTGTRPIDVIYLATPIQKI
jgi:hypothetical protein